MVPLTSLVLPILGSAVVVFVLSSIIHMVLPYHRSDMRKLPDEDAVLENLRRLNIPPGDYGAPHPGSSEGMRKPEFIEKAAKGPLVLMTVSPGGPITMGKSLTLWFLYCVLVSLFAGYLAGRTLGPGTHYLGVFRVVGTAAFMGYSLALLQNSIWYRRAWATTLKSVFDGFVFALFSAGMFGWLWPR
ncbi:MAG TPA: hypothetical protein VMT70_02625 [Vicinamibacteria bacterium]|nr:hypothetical protein [Vicinamibacteria bacterium]